MGLRPSQAEAKAMQGTNDPPAAGSQVMVMTPRVTDVKRLQSLGNQEWSAWIGGQPGLEMMLELR
jgi:hypothetical protein